MSVPVTKEHKTFITHCIIVNFAGALMPLIRLRVTFFHPFSSSVPLNQSTLKLWVSLLYCCCHCTWDGDTF